MSDEKRWGENIIFFFIILNNGDPDSLTHLLEPKKNIEMFHSLWNLK